MTLNARFCLNPFQYFRVRERLGAGIELREDDFAYDMSTLTGHGGGMAQAMM